MIRPSRFQVGCSRGALLADPPKLVKNMVCGDQSGVLSAGVCSHCARHSLCGSDVRYGLRDVFKLQYDVRRGVGLSFSWSTPWLFAWLERFKSRAAPSPFPALFESRRG